MDMIEKVARALHASWIKDWGHLGEADATPFNELHPLHREYGMKQARAAIEAMREPTKEMTDAAGYEPEIAQVTYPAMIDAALK